jgi:hypothetical protein
LVRNSLVDTPSNWDSVGKQKLRKGFLQTLDASEKYINDGPIGQDVSELMLFYSKFLKNRLDVRESNGELPGGGGIGFLIPLADLQFEGKTETKYHCHGQLFFSSTEAGNITFDFSLPNNSMEWRFSISEVGDPTTFMSSANGSGSPTITFPSSLTGLCVDFDLFPSFEYTTTLTVNFTINNSGVVGLAGGSFVKSELHNIMYI